MRILIIVINNIKHIIVNTNTDELLSLIGLQNDLTRDIILY